MFFFLFVCLYDKNKIARWLVVSPIYPTLLTTVRINARNEYKNGGYLYFKNSLIIHKPIDLSMVDKTSRAVVLKPDKTSSLLVCGVQRFSRMLSSNVHKSIIAVNSLDTRFSRNVFEAVQKPRSMCFILSKTTRLRLVVLNPDKTLLLVFYTLHQNKTKKKTVFHRARSSSFSFSFLSILPTYQKSLSWIINLL